MPGLFFLAPVEQVARGITRVIARPRREIIVPNYYRLFILLDRFLPLTVDTAMRLYVTKVLFRGRPFVDAPRKGQGSGRQESGIRDLGRGIKG